MNFGKREALLHFDDLLLAINCSTLTNIAAGVLVAPGAPWGNNSGASP